MLRFNFNNLSYCLQRVPNAAWSPSWKPSPELDKARTPLRECIDGPKNVSPKVQGLSSNRYQPYLSKNLLMSLNLNGFAGSGELGRKDQWFGTERGLPRGKTANAPPPGKWLRKPTMDEPGNITSGLSRPRGKSDIYFAALFISPRSSLSTSIFS